eukprot:11165017-Lingulodinium_polyedra.AAC.1
MDATTRHFCSFLDEGTDSVQCVEPATAGLRQGGGQQREEPPPKGRVKGGPPGAGGWRGPPRR